MLPLLSFNSGERPTLKGLSQKICEFIFCFEKLISTSHAGAENLFYF
jgi:hypothetical protein